MIGTFDAIVTAEDVHRGRPDPECYLYAAQQIQRPPLRCVVVGNSNQVGISFLCRPPPPLSLEWDLLSCMTAGPQFVLKEDPSSLVAEAPRHQRQGFHIQDQG